MCQQSRAHSILQPRGNLFKREQHALQYQQQQLLLLLLLSLSLSLSSFRRKNFKQQVLLSLSPPSSIRRKSLKLLRKMLVALM